MSNINIRPTMDARLNAKYERIIGVLLATMHSDVHHLANFLSNMEAMSPDRKKRELARELIRYVHDRKFLVNRA